MFGPVIDSTTRIVPGLQLSRSFVLGHLTSGAQHYGLGRWLPTFGAFLRPGSSPLPNWRVAQNLSSGAENLLEHLAQAFGQDLILRSAFSTVPGLANLGQTLEIQIDGHQKNMAGVSRELSQLLQGASSLDMVFDTTSYLRVGYDPNSIVRNVLDGVAPRLRTLDTTLGLVEDGLTSIRGRF